MADKITVKNLHILVGLPGSGKTTFCFEQKKKAIYNAIYVDFDDIKKKAKLEDSDSLEYYYAHETYIYGRTHVEDIYVDGLFLTPDDFDFIVSLYLENPRYIIKNVCFEYWEPNVEACLWNDKGRRTISSTVSIKKLVCHTPDVKYFTEKYPSISFSCKHHTIVKKPEWKLFFGEYGIFCDKDTNILRSPGWTVSGTNRDYNGNEWPIDPDEPLEFDAFDELLEKICPSITFLQYKNIRKKCVHIEERHTSDYYCSCLENYWVCDLEALYNELAEKNLITYPIDN